MININFTLSEKALVTLTIFNSLKNEVSKFISEKLSTGTYAPKWNAEYLSSGVYFLSAFSRNLLMDA